jgi:hypothetical protein
VVQAPTCDPGDSCIAHRAESVLFMPEVAKSMSTPKRVQHVLFFAFLEVDFVCRIVWVSLASDFDVSFNGYATREQQPYLIELPLLITCFPKEEPVTAPMPLKIFLFEPAWVFFRVSSSGPLPQTIEDCVINAIERAFARRVPMIVCPTPYFGVEFPDQIGGRHSKHGFDRSPDPIQEGLDVFLGWLSEQFPIGISAHILSEEIEAIRHMRDERLRRREFQPSFAQKLLDERFDPSFQ